MCQRNLTLRRREKYPLPPCPLLQDVFVQVELGSKNLVPVKVIFMRLMLLTGVRGSLKFPCFISGYLPNNTAAGDGYTWYFQ